MAHAAFAEEAKKKKKSLDWVGKCWMSITGSLHDELFLKVIRRTRNDRHLNVRDPCYTTGQDVHPLRIELYSSMIKDGNNDLQS